MYPAHSCIWFIFLFYYCLMRKYKRTERERESIWANSFKYIQECGWCIYIFSARFWIYKKFENNKKKNSKGYEKLVTFSSAVFFFIMYRGLRCVWKSMVLAGLMYTYYTLQNDKNKKTYFCFDCATVCILSKRVRKREKLNMNVLKFLHTNTHIAHTQINYSFTVVWYFIYTEYI